MSLKYNSYELSKGLLGIGKEFPNQVRKDGLVYDDGCLQRFRIKFGMDGLGELTVLECVLVMLKRFRIKFGKTGWFMMMVGFRDFESSSERRVWCVGRIGMCLGNGKEIPSQARNDRVGSKIPNQVRNDSKEVMVWNGASTE